MLTQREATKALSLIGEAQKLALGASYENGTHLLAWGVFVLITFAGTDYWPFIVSLFISGKGGYELASFLASTTFWIAELAMTAWTVLTFFQRPVKVSFKKSTTVRMIGLWGLWNTFVMSLSLLMKLPTVLPLWSTVMAIVLSVPLLCSGWYLHRKTRTRLAGLSPFFSQRKDDAL